MCGINGFAGKVPETAREVFETFATRLMVGTQIRGEHATGVAAYAGPSKKYIGKGPVNAERFVRTPIWKKALSARSAIGHCRYATHGRPERNENNHPFESGKWSLIHNGVIMGHRYIAEREGVKLVSECDSEVILRVFARGAKKGKGPVAGLQRWVDAIEDDNRYLSARYAVALLDHTNGKIRLLRDDGSPCSIVKLPALGIVAFASTTEILKGAMEETRAAHPGFPLLDGAFGFECNPGKVYVLDPNSGEVEHEELTHKRRPVSSRGYYASGDSAKPAASCGGRELTFVCDACSQTPCMCEELTRPDGSPIE